MRSPEIPERKKSGREKSPRLRGPSRGTFANAYGDGSLDVVARTAPEASFFGRTADAIAKNHRFDD
jgi:hypothetical protein